MGSSGSPLNPNLPGRNVAPTRFTTVEQPLLKVSTSFTVATAVATPDSHFGHSYFSPTTDSPTVSTRASQSGTMTPISLPRLAGAASARAIEHKHVTAPPGTYQDKRPQKAGEQAQHDPHVAAQSRFRSVSSPDIQNQSLSKRSIGSLHEDVPVPPIPYHHVLPTARPPANRSQTSSPTEIIRTTRSPFPTHGYNQEAHVRSESRQGLPGGPTSALTGGQRLLSSASADSGMPTQIKVRIAYGSNYVTIVVPSNIKYQTLIDRIDAKMEKHSDCSITDGTAKLRWFDEDSYISLNDDYDIQLLLDEWRQQQFQHQKQGKPLLDLELEWHEGKAIAQKMKRIEIQ